MQAAEEYIPGKEIWDTVDGRARLEALENVISHCLPSFHRTAFRFLGNDADAEDAVQDALLSAYKHLHEFRGQSLMSTWLTSIVRNCALMQLRRRPRLVHVSLDAPINEQGEYSESERLADHRGNPEEQCREAEIKARLRELALQLSPALRRTFYLRALQGLSIHETAGILQVAEGTVKAQLTRARAKVMRSMHRAFAPRRRVVAARTCYSKMAGM
jgi:RNA polymerase sigma-70 factor (ECF subfamily)